jgi:hypothetical protein
VPLRHARGAPTTQVCVNRAGRLALRSKTACLHGSVCGRQI